MLEHKVLSYKSIYEKTNIIDNLRDIFKLNIDTEIVTYKKIINKLQLIQSILFW